jgi:hypothetical protein
MFVGASNAQEEIYWSCAGDKVFGDPSQGEVNSDTSTFPVLNDPHTMNIYDPIHWSGLALAKLTTSDRALVSDEVPHMRMLLAQSELAVPRLLIDLRDAAGRTWTD